ncbi:MAG: DMT family transporter [Bacteroidales bacterium]
MFQSHFGEFAALMTAVFWTVTSMSFEAAGKKIGSLSVNLIRLFLALIIYSVYLHFTRGMAFSVDASWHAWIWLSLSGIVGFAVGDLLLFQAFVVVGARVSMLMMSLVPPITALIGWMILGETLSLQSICGMVMTISGIVLVVMKRQASQLHSNGKSKLRFSYPLAGILLAFGGAAGQAVGLVLSKYGMKDYDAFAASQIRVFAGFISFIVIFFVMKRWSKVRQAVKNRKGMMFTGLGSVFGPFWCFLFLARSSKYQYRCGCYHNVHCSGFNYSIAILFFKEKVNLKEVLGAMLAVGGVALLFLE